MPRFCVTCGTPLVAETASFCTKCGAAVVSPPDSSKAIPAQSVSGSGWSITKKVVVAAVALTLLAMIVVAGTIGVRNDKPKVEADFASAPYAPVGEGNASVIVGQYDFNHKNTGRQGVLVETQMNHFQPDDGQPSGHHYFIYSPKIHSSNDGSMKCDIGSMLIDPHGQPFKVLMFGVTGEGFITSTIYRENENVVGSYPGTGCDFIFTAVHSFGAIPEDVWDRADALWQREEAKALAERAKAKEPVQTKVSSVSDSDQPDPDNAGPDNADPDNADPDNADPD